MSPPWAYSLGVVIGAPVEFALAALVCAFRRTGAAGPDQPAPGAVDDRHADVAVVQHLDGGGEPGCRWSSDHAPAVLDDYFEAAGLDEAPLSQSVGPAGRRMKAKRAQRYSCAAVRSRSCGRGGAASRSVERDGRRGAGVADRSRQGARRRDHLEAGQRPGIAAVPHGFRSRSETDPPREVVEAALAHVIDNRAEAACARSDVPRRRARTVFPLRR